MKRRKWWFVGLALAALTFCILVVVSKILQRLSQAHSRPVGHGNVTFDVSSDGSKIVFAAPGQGGRDLYLLDRDSGRVHALTRSPDYEIMPAFSADGLRIAFTRGKDGVRADHLCVMELSSGKIDQLTDGDENTSSPAFVPDGLSILFALETQYSWGGLGSNWNERGMLVKMNLKTKNQTQLLSEARQATSPTVSRDGTLIAWAESHGVCVAPIDDLGAHRVVLDSGDSPSFSPDGKRLAVVTGTYIPDFHVETVPLGGGKPFKVANTGGAMQVRFLTNGRLVVLREFWRDGGFGEPTRALWEISVDGKDGREVLSEAQIANPLGSSNLSPKGRNPE